MSRERGLSLQVAARVTRYRFFVESLKQFGGERIATAHHADDQIETILMRLLRGTGPMGLQGIPLRREGLYIRPLLWEWKTAIREYASSNGIPYREDPGNRENHFYRNRIRNILIPYLEAYNPSLKETLLRLAMWAGEDRETIDYFIENVLSDIGYCRAGDEITMRRDRLLNYPLAVWKEVVRRAVRDLGAGYGPEGHSLFPVMDFLRDARSGRRIHLPAGLVLGRDFEELFLTKRRTKEARADLRMELVIGPAWKGEFRQGSNLWKVQVELKTRAEIDDPHGGTFHQHFDVRDILPPLCIRPWHSGDLLRQRGMEGRKKVSDLIAERGIPRRRRGEVLVLADEKSVLWVIGIRRGGRGWVLDDTRQVVSVVVGSS